MEIERKFLIKELPDTCTSAAAFNAALQDSKFGTVGSFSGEIGNPGSQTAEDFLPGQIGEPGIQLHEPGDLLVIDRSLEPTDGDLAVCCLDGEFTLKRIHLVPGAIWLIPSNESFDPILVTPDNRFEIWGVVSHTIKNNRRPRQRRKH